MMITYRSTTIVGLMAAVLLAIQVAANGQEYWSATESQVLDASKDAWTKQEIGRLLDAALPADGPTDPKVAALKELVSAVAHKSELPDGFEETILKILPRPEAGIAAPTAKIVGMLKLEAARSELESWATSCESGYGVEALKALVSLGGEKTRRFLQEQYVRNCQPPKVLFGAEDSTDMPLRRANILCAMIEHDIQKAAPGLVNHFSKFPGDRCNKQVFEMILTQEGGSSAFARALTGRRLSATVVKIGLEVVGDSEGSHEELTQALEEAAEQGGADQPATRSESKAEGRDKPQPEPEVRPR